MENTVTISIDRFKELESIEEAYRLINEGQEVVVTYYQPYNSRYAVYNINDTTKELIDVYKQEVGSLTRKLSMGESEISMLEKALELYQDRKYIMRAQLHNWNKIDKYHLHEYIEHYVDIINSFNKLPWYKRIFKKI